METVIKAIQDTPIPMILILAGLLFLLLGFVNKLGGIIEVSSEQRKLTIPIGLLVLTIGLVLNFIPSNNNPSNPAYIPPTYGSNEHWFHHDNRIKLMSQPEADEYCESLFRQLKVQDNLKDFDANQVNHVWAHIENGDCIANT